MHKIISKYWGEKFANALFEVFFLINYLKTLVINYKPIRKDNQQKKKNIIIGLVPTHGNLGDYALYIAAKNIVIDNFPGYDIQELTIPKTPHELFKLRQNMDPQTDYVFLIGGGNMGSRYLTEEMTRQVIFYFFRKFRRIQLPQSSSYSDSLSGRVILEITKKVFKINKHNLLITSRDKDSYEFFKNNFENRVLLLPDSVLYLNYQSPELRSGKILYCIREDKESNFTFQERKNLTSNLRADFGDNLEAFNTINLDTTITNHDAYLLLIEKIKTSKLVITDRLHGVIFSYITNTPVIGIQTKDHKLLKFFDWIKNSKRCILIRNMEEINNAAKQLLTNKEKASNISLKNEFSLLFAEINKL